MIEIDALTKVYDGTTVVDHVSMSIPARSICVVVGTSGSGKTTLMRMINRLVEPSSGTVRIDGEDTRRLPAYELRRRIGYAIQGHGLFPHRTVGQNIATVPKLLGWDRQRIARRVDELLTLFQLDPAVYRDRLPMALSGGQQQRVGVARALAAEPNILLMDEPFGALDPVIRAKAQDDLLAIQRRFGTTIVLVTHDMEEAIHLGDRIAVMDKGKLLQYAPPAEIIAKPATEFVDQLLGTGDRPFRLLSLIKVAELLEPGDAAGEPVTSDTSLRQAYSEALWTGRDAVPVVDNGARVGRVTLAAMARRAAAAMRLGLIIRLLVLALLLAFLLSPTLFEPLLAPLAKPGQPVIYNQGALLDLTINHLWITAIATVAATIVAVGLAILVTRPFGAEFLALSRSLANVGQTFPPVAVLAIAVPMLGFGTAPTLVALFLYALLPIFENALTGLTGLPPSVTEAARGMGMSGLQRLLGVELPLALPVILGGIRLAAVISLSTATIGSTVAARTLGEVIIAGLLSNNTAFVLQGGLIVAVLAVLIYDAFAAIERLMLVRIGAVRA